MIASQSTGMCDAQLREISVAFLRFYMVIAEKTPKEKEIRVAAQSKAKEPKVAAQKKTAESFGSSESPLSMVKNFVCKYLCQ